MSCTVVYWLPYFSTVLWAISIPRKAALWSQASASSLSWFYTGLSGILKWLRNFYIISLRASNIILYAYEYNEIFILPLYFLFMKINTSISLRIGNKRDCHKASSGEDSFLTGYYRSSDMWKILVAKCTLRELAISAYRNGKRSFFLCLS